MPIVNIQILEGRSEEKIKEVISNVTGAMCTTLNISKETVRVVITETPKTHWGIGGVSVSDYANR